MLLGLDYTLTCIGNAFSNFLPMLSLLNFLLICIGIWFFGSFPMLFLLNFLLICIGIWFTNSPPMLFYIFTEKSARMVSHPDGLCSYLLFLIIFFATFEVNSSTNHYNCSNKKNYENSNRCVITCFYCFCGCCSSDTSYLKVSSFIGFPSLSTSVT